MRATSWTAPTFGGAAASGGPVMPGRFSLVGEQGPELFAPGQSGQILPNRGWGGPTIHMYITTPDAQSFQHGSGEIQQWLMRMMQVAQRNA